MIRSRLEIKSTQQLLLIWKQLAIELISGHRSTIKKSNLVYGELILHRVEEMTAYLVMCAFTGGLTPDEMIARFITRGEMLISNVIVHCRMLNIA